MESIKKQLTSIFNVIYLFLRVVCSSVSCAIEYIQTIGRDQKVRFLPFLLQQPIFQLKGGEKLGGR